MEDIGVVVSLFIAACALSVTVIGLRRKSDTEYTDRLERRVEELEGEQILIKRELEECKRARVDLTEQNFVLLNKLFYLSGGDTNRGPARDP